MKAADMPASNTLNRPIDPAIQLAINELNVSVAAIAETKSLASTEVVMILTGLLAMWASRANDEREERDAEDFNAGVERDIAD